MASNNTSDTSKTPVNFWTVSEGDFQTLDGIGPKLADKLLTLWKVFCKNQKHIICKDLANAALKEKQLGMIISVEVYLPSKRTDDPFSSLFIQSNSSEINDLQRQVKDLTMDNELLHKRFQELDARMVIRFSQIDNKFNLLIQQMNILLERPHIQNSNETPPKYSRRSEFEHNIRPLNLKYDLNSSDSKFHRLSPTTIDPNVSPSCTVELPNVRSQHPQLTTQQQQEEINHTLAVISSCCPKDDIYNCSSISRTKPSPKYSNVTTMTTNMLSTPSPKK